MKTTWKNWENRDFRNGSDRILQEYASHKKNIKNEL